MKKILVSIALLASALVMPVLTAAPAGAVCRPPDGQRTIWSIANKSFTYHPTNVASDWVSLRRGGSITYNQTKTMQVSASVTATVSAEAGIIFAKASASLGVTVGASKSWSRSWNYQANVPADTKHKYRLHAYHYTANFSVMKKTIRASDCRYHNAWSSWQRVKHAPAAAQRNVWRLDKAAA